MKKSLFLFFSFYLVTFFACQKVYPPLGIAEQYYPESRLLADGIVNKYYTHYLPTDKKDISTDILYRSLQFSPDGTIYSKNFNPAFKPTTHREWLFKDNKTIVLKQESYSYWGQDTFQHVITQPVLINWKTSDAQLEKVIHYPQVSRKWEGEQTALRDTIILDKPAIIIERTEQYINYRDGDTIPGSSPFFDKSIYVAGLGLYYNESIDANGKRWIELVEQIPMKTFNEMANHGRERVAYIKAADAIDNDPDFKLCGTQNHLFDYYNGGDLYGYKGGKRVIWDYMDQYLDSTKLFKESGYLTFRFIVNCEGTAGRFVTEQAELNFERKTFNEETLAHCYELIKGLKDWDPTHRNGETVDAVFYFTFKLKDGVLIDILPKF